jgi:hypothetical protein
LGETQVRKMDLGNNLPVHEGTPLIDIGINLGNKQYNPDREAVVDRGLAHGVGKMIITGMKFMDIG